MSRPLRIGLLGAGGIAQVSHLPAYARIPEAVVTAIADVDRGKAERVASRYNVPAVAESYDAVAVLDTVDAVDICLPNHLHAPAALAALAAGKHVLCEKPFSRSAEEARAMVEAARKADRVLMGGFNHRFREDARILKRFVDKGELGRVFYGKTGWLMQAASWTPGSWREEKRYAGGGVLMDLGIQMLDLALWLLDMPRVVSVSASAHPKPTRETLETTATALLRLEGGCVLSLEVAWGLLVAKDMAYVNLFGEKGAALLHPLRLHKEKRGSLVDVTPALRAPRNLYKQSYEHEIRHFVECARGSLWPDSPGEDALALLEISEALYRSAGEGKEVVLRG